MADTILDSGFDERYSKLEGMFGAGIYFADISSKSNRYTEASEKGERKLLICRVILGNIYFTDTAIKGCRRPPTKDGITYHSIKAISKFRKEVDDNRSTLLYDEYVIYNGVQAFPEYLLTYQPDYTVC
eukprot:TRINITY_DN16330_c0_g1_i1.p1 TRINITY_DN16330_c0_g1~~TRINITY_DN16330_c0_g1_i1.p1  ORF type:complete len:147 (-),score=10.05 TRINITY_DN16330_c0_g1_i1:43-426(-)